MTQRITDDEVIAESRGFLDTPEFDRYRESVCLLVSMCGEATVRQIHTLLKDEARPRWTMDALAGMDEFGILPTRYRLPAGHQIEHVTRRKWNGGTLHKNKVLV
jgi:hypothetical protein